VATVISNLKKGMNVHMSFGDRIFTITAKEEIPYGHKIAIKNIKHNENVITYGEPIGRATKDIGSGDHVYIHNLKDQNLTGNCNINPGTWP
jgi:altronate dehydratase small subunit